MSAGVVTENQFSCGLALACTAKDAAHLSREEVQLLIGAFRTPNGVQYRNFCRDVDNCLIDGTIARCLQDIALQRF